MQEINYLKIPQLSIYLLVKKHRRTFWNLDPLMSLNKRQSTFFKCSVPLFHLRSLLSMSHATVPIIIILFKLKRSFYCIINFIFIISIALVIFAKNSPVFHFITISVLFWNKLVSNNFLLISIKNGTHYNDFHHYDIQHNNKKMWHSA